MDSEIYPIGTKLVFESELRENILPFWMKNAVDHECGGFYGAVDQNGNPHNEIERSSVLCSRILWTFSMAARKFEAPNYLDIARHAYIELTTRFWDHKYKGVYWSIDRFGNPIQNRKHTYAQAFAIYGLCAYFNATKDENSLKLAKQLFELIEEHSFDDPCGGYIESRARNWSPQTDMRLSDKDLNSEKSMNTLLHLMEAYTALAALWPDTRVANKLSSLVEIFLDTIIDIETGTQKLFFDREWKSLLDHVSYGHDIETSWLFLETAKMSGMSVPDERIRIACLSLAQSVYENGLEKDGSLTYESGPNGFRITSRQWWAHAEAVVGFYNAFQISGKPHFLEAAGRVWCYIQNNFIDQKNGDWFKLLDENGRPVTSHYKIGPWECPYHHARMCFEMMKRLP